MPSENELNVLRQARKWPEVEEMAREALLENPASLFHLHALEQALREQKKEADLPDVWRLLVERHGEDYPFAARLGAALYDESPEEAVPILRRGLKAAAEEKDAERVEETWLLLVDARPDDLEFFLDIAEVLDRRKERRLAADLLQTLFEPLEKRRAYAHLLGLVRRVSELIPRDAEFRKEVERVYRLIYSGRPDLSLLVDKSELMRSGSIPEALNDLDRFLQFGAGQLLYHSEWGVGEVKRLDPVLQKISIDFPRKPAHTMALELAVKTLEPLHEEDLRVLLERRPDRLADLKANHPAQLVHAALRSLRGKASGRELKDILTPRAVAPAEWTAFWAQASKALKTDPQVQVSGGGARVFELREKAVTYEDEIRIRFEEGKKLSQKADVLLEYLAHTRSEPADLELLSSLVRLFADRANREKTVEGKIEGAYVLDEVQKAFPEVAGEIAYSPQDFIEPLPRAAAAAEKLRIDRHQERWVREIFEAGPEGWLDAFHDLILRDTIGVRDLIADLLRDVEGGDRVLRRAFERASSAPREYPGAFIWFCDRGIRVPRDAELFGARAANLMERMLRLLDHLAHVGRREKGKGGEAIRAHASRIRQLVRKSGMRLLTTALETADPTSAESIRNALVANSGFDPGHRGELLVHLRKHFPDLAETPHEEQQDRAERAEAAALLCLRASLDARREEVRVLGEVEIPQNARDIEVARGHGDLSENAEYKYAKERQTFLHTRLRELQEMLNRARAVDLSEVQTDRAVFGTRVTLRNLDTDEAAVYSVLGPWESDPDRGIVSYQSGIAQSFLGKEKGAEVQIVTDSGSRRMRIEEIEKVRV